MPSDINQFVATGRLTKDPELRTVPSGKSVCNTSIAINEGFFSKTKNKWDQKTTFVNITLWQKAAENFAERMSKGDWVLVTGKLEVQSWTATDGTKRYSPNVNVRDWSSGPKPKVEADTSFDTASFDSPAEDEFSDLGDF